MSTLGTVYKSLSGLLGFTRRLDDLSHNVGNLNTPGFKAKNSYFRELHDGQFGSGVAFAGDETRFTQGDFSRTGQDTHLAIQGAGFFILENADGQRFYTRAGRFEMSGNRLIDAGTGHSVLARNNDGKLQKIDISSLRNSVPEPTTAVNFRGNLNAGTATGTVFPASTDQPVEASVYDGTGKLQTLSLTFTKEIGNRWQVKVQTTQGVDITTETLEFSASGSPLTGFNSFDFDYTPTGGQPQALTFNFGTPGEFSGVTGFTSSNSNITATRDNGRAAGQLSRVSFDDKGQLNLDYSNSEQRVAYQIVLADYSDKTLLRPGTGSLFSSPVSPDQLGIPGEGNFGSIRPQGLEKSNVDISTEFAEIIIIQRGYQASSQILSVSNEMLEELYNTTRGR